MTRPTGLSRPAQYPVPEVPRGFSAPGGGMKASGEASSRILDKVEADPEEPTRFLSLERDADNFCARTRDNRCRTL